MHHDQIKRLVAQALSQGGVRKSAIRTEWNLGGNCTSPVVREIHVRPPADEKPRDETSKFLDAVMAKFPGAEVVRDERDRDARPQRDKYIVVTRESSFPLTLTITLRCRKCDRCLKLRQRLWSDRARRETATARRTWFGTLTLKPETQLMMLSRARKRLSMQGIDFETLSFREQFAERVKQISLEITKYLKRVRKESGASLRYLLVAEHHKSGLPHFHMLVHELDEIGVRHSTLSKQWGLGFEKWRLVSEPSEALYLTKYLSKTAAARVRASRGYGRRDVLTDIAAAGRRENYDRLLKRRPQAASSNRPTAGKDGPHGLPTGQLRAAGEFSGYSKAFERDNETVGEPVPASTVACQ